MRPIILLTLFSFAIFIFSAGWGQTQERPPAWAYPVNPPNYQRTTDDGSIRHVPGSAAGYSLSQVRDLYAAPDWHPDEHPPMPKIVAVGRKPEVMACGVCHRADGPGGPENASLAGLSAEYIIQQTREFGNGQRIGSSSRTPTDLMIKSAKAVTNEELAEAAAYFSALKPRANMTVRESDVVPKTEVRELFLAAVEGGGSEPIGQRIIELADNVENFISRDTHVRFIAYVPLGSIERGQALAASGEPQSRCGACHGEALAGDIAPRLAGRSPTYLFRQLYDFKSGARKGSNSDQMKSIAEALSIEDMISLAAYAGSRASP